MTGEYPEKLRQLLARLDEDELDLGQVLSEARILVNEHHAEEEKQSRAWYDALEAIRFRFNAKAKRDGRDRGFLSRRRLNAERSQVDYAIRRARRDIDDIELNKMRREHRAHLSNLLDND